MFQDFSYDREYNGKSVLLPSTSAQHPGGTLSHWSSQNCLGLLGTAFFVSFHSISVASGPWLGHCKRLCLHNHSVVDLLHCPVASSDSHPDIILDKPGNLPLHNGKRSRSRDSKGVPNQVAPSTILYWKMFSCACSVAGRFIWVPTTIESSHRTISPLMIQTPLQLLPATCKSPVKSDLVLGQNSI